MWGDNIGKMVPISHAVGGLNTGTMAAVPLTLTLNSYNSVSPCMSPAPFELLIITGAQDECLQVSL